MNRSFFVAILFFILVSSCNQQDTQIDDKDGISAFSADSLGKHIAQLSSDDFTGRKPFTEGETKTINYLKEQFIGAGLEPGNGDSYFQEVPYGSDHYQCSSIYAGSIRKRKFYIKRIG